MLKLALSFLILTPLVGAFLNGIRWKSKNLKLSFFIAAFSCFVSFLSSLLLFYFLFFEESKSLTFTFFEWINIEQLKISFSFLVDPLSAIMLLVITGVGFLIHVFSFYYMSHDARPAKYFSYLNLFIFSMINLVLADNLFLMFLGWEAVGLCSYLLIGFWFKDSKKALAGMKAFLVNRIGDMGFLIGMFLVFHLFHSLNFINISEIIKSGDAHSNLVKWACLCLFIGAMGKSAQIPLYMWLPSAMAGPTPVSALIHAATMVTAGVYLILRMNFLFTLAPEVLTFISWVGAFTAFIAAIIACAQSDIKKVLAYSTVSQLGYMFVAAGLTAFTTALFHLVTHAFFKALLFLSAGAIIHVLKGEQNIYRMGGLKKEIPLIWFCFLVGFLALIGLPPFSGFFSKDEILWASFSSGHFGLFAFSLVTALLTAFYMTRLYILVFHGESKQSKNLTKKEGFATYLPLVLLAFLSLVGGFLGVPHLFGKILPGHPPHLLELYLKPVLGVFHFKGSYLAEGILIVSSVLCVLFLVLVTSWFYLYRKEKLLAIKTRHQNIFSFLEDAMGVDSFCYSKVVKPCLEISKEMWQGVDLCLIQGFIKLIQKWCVCLKELFESWQSGKTQHYILFMILGLIALMLSFLIY